MTTAAQTSILRKVRCDNPMFHPSSQAPVGIVPMCKYLLHDLQFDLECTHHMCYTGPFMQSFPILWPIINLKGIVSLLWVHFWVNTSWHCSTTSEFIYTLFVWEISWQLKIKLIKTLLKALVYSDFSKPATPRRTTLTHIPGIVKL